MRQFFYLCLGLLLILVQTLIGARALFPDAFMEKDNKIVEELIQDKKPILDKLPPEDLAFIANNPVIIAGVDPNFYPVEMFNERGQYSGLGADYLKIISYLTGLEFRPGPQTDWASTEESTRKGDIQILPAAAKTGRRSEYMLFTPPYVSLPGIIMTKRGDVEQIKGLDDLKGKKVAVTRDYAWHDFVREFHPEIEIVPVSNTLEALRKVVNGDADAVLDYEFNLLEKTRSAGILQLEKAAEVPSNYGHAIGVRKDLPELFDVISIALAQITASEHQKLTDKWLTQSSPESEGKQLQWIFFFLTESVLLCLCLNWLINRKIRTVVKNALQKCGYRQGANQA